MMDGLTSALNNLIKIEFNQSQQPQGLRLNNTTEIKESMMA